MKQKIGFACLSVVGAVILYGIFLIDRSNLGIDLTKTLFLPSGEHLFGFDNLGRDLLVQVAEGGWLAFRIATCTVFCVFCFALIFALASIWGPKWIQVSAVRIIDLVLAFPGFLVVLALSAVMQPSFWAMVLTLSISSWAGFARILRSELLILRSGTLVMAAEAIGASRLRQIFVHTLPQLYPIFLTQAGFVAAYALLAEASLSFLGLGFEPGTPTWGALLSAGRKYLIEAPHLCFFPAAALTLSLLGLGLIADSLQGRSSTGP